MLEWVDLAVPNIVRAAVDVFACQARAPLEYAACNTGILRSMKHVRYACAAFAAATAALFAGCSRSPVAHPATPVAFVSILPHEYLATRVAGDRFQIHTLIGPGQSPHSYSPTPSQIAQLSEARVLFRAGIEFEETLVQRIAQIASGITIVDLREGIVLRAMEGGHEHDEQGEVGHDHGRHEDHQAGVPDPHVWMSPVLAARQAATIRDVLSQIDTAGAAVFSANYDSLAADLDSLHQRLTRSLAPHAGAKLFVFHPAFGYLADQYGLEQIAVETGGKEPSAQSLARLIELAHEYHPAAMFVQPQFSQKSARAVAAQMGCAVVPIDPLPRNYLQSMSETARAIEDALRDH